MIPITTFAGKTVAVFGLARSGIVSAEALRAGGANVACWDDGAGGREAAQKAGLQVENLKDPNVDWSRFAALVLAPGVPLTHPEPHWTVQRAKAAGVEIIGDIELFFRERAKIAPKSPVVCITGTNGKSTTTALIAHILKSAGKDVQMGGNIGVGVLALEPLSEGRCYVIEMSSFQIDLTPTLNPTVGVLLNITPDHLDRHGTMENYAAVKARLAEGASTAVINRDDDWAHQSVARRELDDKPTVRISLRPNTDAELYADSGQIYQRSHAVAASIGPKVERVADLAGIGSLRGTHNSENAMAAFAAVEELGIPATVIAEALRTFPGLEHRLEELGHVGQTLIVNDSKGTNADSTDRALASFSGPIFWIAGGVAKEGGIESLYAHFIGGERSKVRKAYLIGKCAPDFAATLEKFQVPWEIFAGNAINKDQALYDALEQAISDAETTTADEPVVLLSPACASYDQFESFEDRGNRFRMRVQTVPGFTKKG